METFDRFVLAKKEDLKRIAKHTRGEHQYGDVVNKAWMMAQKISSLRNIPIDFLDAEFQQLLLSYLYQHLVRYSELNVRRAVRLDHASRSDAEEGASHALMNMLVSGSGNDPLSYLIASEDSSVQRDHGGSYFSLAAAYVLLLRRFDNRMHSVANYLLISLSYAYRCCAKARLLATQQHTIALVPHQTTPAPGPWRRCRASRTPQQLEFDFDEELPLALLSDILPAHMSEYSSTSPQPAL